MHLLTSHAVSEFYSYVQNCFRQSHGWNNLSYYMDVFSKDGKDQFFWFFGEKRLLLLFIKKAFFTVRVYYSRKKMLALTHKVFDINFWNLCPLLLHLCIFINTATCKHILQDSVTMHIVQLGRGHRWQRHHRALTKWKWHKEVTVTP